MQGGQVAFESTCFAMPCRLATGDRTAYRKFALIAGLLAYLAPSAVTWRQRSRRTPGSFGIERVMTRLFFRRRTDTAAGAAECLLARSRTHSQGGCPSRRRRL